MKRDRCSYTQAKAKSESEPPVTTDEAVDRAAHGSTNYDSRQETIEHIMRVRELLYIVQNKLEARGFAHDQTKLGANEKPIFDRVTGKLKGLTYGSEEYKASLKDLGPALAHHYAHNSHHPEHESESSEEWREVAGYSKLYEVSNLGRIRSLARVVARDGGQGALTINEIIRKGHITPKGYVRVTLSKGGNPKNHMVHVLVAGAFLGDAPSERHEVNHKSGIKSDNRARNLEWMTPSQNLQHAYDNELKTAPVKYVFACESLELTAYGAVKMAEQCNALGHLKVTATGVYNAAMRGGNHHDLAFTASLVEHELPYSGVDGMSLLDVIEMLCDWKAAGERHADGSIDRSLKVNRERFKISDQLHAILENTVRELGWSNGDMSHGGRP